MTEDIVSQQVEISPEVVWSNNVSPVQPRLLKHWSRIPAGIDT